MGKWLPTIWIEIDEAAKRLSKWLCRDVSERSVLAWIRSGRLHARKINSSGRAIARPLARSSANQDGRWQVDAADLKYLARSVHFDRGRRKSELSGGLPERNRRRF